MIKCFKQWRGAHPRAKWFYPIWLTATLLLFFLSPLTDKPFLWLYLGLGVLIMFILRPSSPVYRLTMEAASGKTIFTVLLAVIITAACVLPMGLNPMWNGENPGYRNQYELMAEAILDGRIEIVYDEVDELTQLENPYDPVEREAAGVNYHWDHAYYKGHYYMYFGVVPVFLLFLPYRILTGSPLTTYHATQIFVALTIAGFFVLFHFLAKRFFKNLPYFVYLALASAFSVMSVWYATAAPALYCTAITGGIALEIWSLYFFIRAVWGETRENRQIFLAGIGALLGALVFGCRPTIGLANIAVIPMLAEFLKQRKFSWKLLGKLALAALPYLLVAIALMLYNYARFENPFEFGQSYQLTEADQTQYSSAMDLNTLLHTIYQTLRYFFGRGILYDTFPFLSTAGVFYNFPILLLCAAMLIPSVFKTLRSTKFLPLLLGLFVSAVIIAFMDIAWTPYMQERYRMDVYFLMGLACFLVIGCWFQNCSSKQSARLSCAVSILSVITMVCSALYCFRIVGETALDVVSRIGAFLQLG